MTPSPLFGRHRRYAWWRGHRLLNPRPWPTRLGVATFATYKGPFDGPWPPARYRAVWSARGARFVHDWWDGNDKSARWGHI